MKHCTTDKCPQILDSSCVFYEGASLIFSGINTNDSVETVIQKLNLKLESIPGINLDNYYTKNEADNLFLNYYIKTETYSQTQIDNIVSDLELEIDNKINSSDVYLKTQTYSQTEINGFLSGKQNSIGYAPENSANKSDSYTASSSTTYASTKALVDGLDTKLDKGTYTGTAQDLKNSIETKNIEQDGRIENLEGLNYTWSPTNRTLTLYDNNGKILSSVTFEVSNINGLQTALDNKENISNKQNNLTADVTNTKYPTVTAVNDGLATKQKKLSSFDESLLIESDGNIEGNVSLFTEYFNTQNCILAFTPIQILGIYKNGLKLLQSEYTITLPKTISINTYTDENIEIQYTHLKS